MTKDYNKDKEMVEKVKEKRYTDLVE